MVLPATSEQGRKMPQGFPAKSNGSSKKLGSLSSFQPTLNFSAVPSGPSRSASSSTSHEDRKKMPPPPPGTTGKRGLSSSSSALNGHNSSKVNGGDTKGKGKADEPIVVDEDMEDSEPDLKDNQEDTKYSMWADKYRPTSEADLAPGKARIAKVKEWLHMAIHGYPQCHTSTAGGLSQASIDKVRKYRRVLLLSGPAGAGKTTTIRVIAEEMGVELVEWGESIEEWSLGSGIDRESPITKLSTFLSRHSYSSLSLQSRPSSVASSKRKRQKPKALLMTSLPNLTHNATKEAFHQALLEFCKSFSTDSSPLIIIHSDSGSGGRAEESWMDRERGGREGSMEVLGKDVKDGPWCTEIDFISLAPTFISKALTRVMHQAIPDVSSRPPTSALQLIALTSHGDLRSAINSLQLLCSRGNAEQGKKRKRVNDTDGPKKKGKGSRGGKGAKVDLSDDLRAVLDAVTRREQSLNLFHALGKVFYNKRLDDPNIDKEDAELLATIRALPKDEPLPAHLSHFNRSKSLVDIEAFLPTIPVDASSFSLWLHQSLPSFCSEIEEAGLAIDDLCNADIMKTDDDIWQSSPQAIAYALHLSVRGALMALPSPVPRKNQKVMKPQFFASYKAERDNIQLLDHAAAYIGKKAVLASGKMAEMPISNSGQEFGVWPGLISKSVLATELVPMLVKIQSLSSNPLLPASIKPLSMPTWNTLSRPEELRENEDVAGGDDFEEMAAGEDGMGQVSGGGWDEEVSAVEEDEGLEEDIEDWD